VRIYFSIFTLFLLIALLPIDAIGQTEPERKRLGDSSVTMIVPESIRKKPDTKGLGFLPAFRVLEEPKSFVKIWTPRFTDKKAAKTYAKQSGSKFKEILEIEINGKAVPMMITHVKTGYKSGDVYKALFDDKNSIVVIATVFDDAPITRNEVLDAFKTIEINVEKPIGNFDGAPFTVDLVPPFEFVFSSFNSLFIKSDPELDESHSKPSIIVGYEDIFTFQGEPKIDTLETAAKYLFPIDKDNFYQTESPNFSKIEIISEGYEEVGPGKAYKLEARYKDRMALQYVWDKRGPSEFDDYLFFFAMGDTKYLESIKNDVSKIADSLEFQSNPKPRQSAQKKVTTKVAPQPIPRLADKTHPLSECEIKKRKLTCDAMRSHSGFIFNTNLRSNRDTLQYQISTLTSSLRNQEFKDLFETQVRTHMKEAVPLAADLMGWDMEDPATTEMLNAATVALEKLVVSPEEQKPDPNASELEALMGNQKVEFEGGRFYGTRSSIMNNYSLYVDKPGKKKKK